MQRDRLDVATGWLATAEQDLTLARRLANEMPNVACFHAQQAAEESVKALLVAACGDAARDHAIIALLAEAATIVEVDETLNDHARRLDKFYVSTRYPDALGGLDPTVMFGESEALEAGDRAAIIVAFARAQIATITENLGRDDRGR